MSSKRIIGVCLVRNEEHFAVWSLMNIADFCDHIYVLNNNSTDRTRELIKRVQAKVDHVTLIDVEDAYDTHRFVEPFAGQNVWVFGVDGDEIYDPAGLRRLRPRILSGELDEWWRIHGWSLHVCDLDWAASRATGYVQPATRTITKLYNFSVISAWSQGKHQRLHGQNMTFMSGGGQPRNLDLWHQQSLDTCDLRALHMCFFPRSPLDRAAGSRFNPSEARKSRSLRRRIREGIAVRLAFFRQPVPFKDRFYAGGPLESVDVSSFGSPDDWPQIDPRGSEVKARLGQTRRAPQPAE